MQKFTPAKSWR